MALLVDPRSRPELMALLLAQLDAPGILLPSTLSDLFEAVDVATDPSDAPIERELVDDAAEPIGDGVAARLLDAQSLLAGFGAMVGEKSPRPDTLTRQLLVAVADGLTGRERRAHIDAAIREVERTVAAVAVPDGGRITLTARSGTIPLTIRRETDFPITVRIRFDSTKLEFPDGDSRVVVLEGETTRLDLSVRTLASGAFPLEIDVVSPDGSLAVARARYTVQSTAVSGVGLFLSAGAGLFLAAWWGSHWHRARRSRRLVPRHAKRS